MSSRSRVGLTVLCLVAGVLLAHGQESRQPTDSGAPKALPSTQSLPKDYPVITYQGTCPKAAAKQEAKELCPAVLTREQFEDLVHAVNPKMIKSERRQLAETYGKMLALSQEALRRGMDKEPDVQALLKYLQATALSSTAYKEILRESNHVPPKNVSQYYESHKASFERYQFEKVFIPREKHVEPASMEEAMKNVTQPPSTEEEMKELAESVRTRALAGEDFLALQKEVFQKSGITGDPSVKVTDALPDTLPKEQNEAFHLAVGGVSPIMSDDSGYFIYKLVSKQLPPLASIRDQVRLSMQNENLSQTMAKIQKLSESKVNMDYFEKYDPPPADENEMDVDND